MKILSLNTWAGVLKDELLSFVQTQADLVDVLMFQEVTSTETALRSIADPKGGAPLCANLYQELSKVLPGFTGYFSATVTNLLQQEDVSFGVAMFVKNSITVTDFSQEFVFGSCQDDSDQPHARALQYCVVSSDASEIALCNLHGLHTGTGKGDTPERLEQSRKVLEVMARVSKSFVFCGDLNLSPDTESLAMLTEGNQDLITTYGITSTRSAHYTRENKYADYCIASPEIQVNDFKVLEDEVSDHLPLVVDITL